MVDSRTAKALAVLGLVIACASAVKDSGSATPYIQLLWETDMAGADDWASFLTSKGFQVARYQAHDADKIVQHQPDLIIIADDTTPVWTDMADVNAIRDSGRPVLAIGSGGSHYYDAANASIGWLMSGVHFGQSRIYVPNPANPLYTSPNAIAVPADGIVAVHQSDVRAVTPWIQGLPKNVSVLAKDPAAMDYATICTEASRYTMWSFYTASPALLTEDGRKLFENVVWHCLREAVPEVKSLLLVSIGAAIMCPIAARRGRPGSTEPKRDSG